ncbi:MAG: hypothetical protein EBX50_14370 [Chitinophagia bacterium]|nr:hypothetical protein [Chitinophagia bacterium]
MSVLQQTQETHRKLDEIHGLFAQAMEQTRASVYKDYIHTTFVNAKQFLEREAVRLDGLLSGSPEVGSSDSGSGSGSDSSSVDILTILSTIDSLDLRVHTLLDAIASNNRSLVMFLLEPFEGHPDPSELYQFPIGYACGMGHIEIVRLLLKDPRVDPGAHNNSAMCHAVYSEYPDIVRLLLTYETVDPTIQDNLVLNYAVQHGYIDIFRDLYGRQQVYSSLTPNNILVFFRTACSKGYTEFVQLFLKDSRLKLSTHPSVIADLILVVCGLGHHEILQLMLEDPRFANISHVVGPAFSRACNNGHIEIVRLLLQDGRVRTKWDADIALSNACNHNHVEIIRLLLRDPDINPTHRDNDLLFKACSLGNVEICRLLLSDSRVVQSLQRRHHTLEQELQELQGQGQVVQEEQQVIREIRELQQIQIRNVEIHRMFLSDPRLAAIATQIIP